MKKTLRTALKPSTVETIRDQLEFQRYQRPSWIDYHFTAIAERNTAVTYEDVEGMTETQVDSVRHLLATQVLHGRQVIRKRKAARISLLSNYKGTDDNAREDEWPIRVKQLEEALRDLCAVYGLSCPL